MNSGEAKGNNNGSREKYRFSVDHMDTSADPLTDFYKYAAGIWVANNPVPSDKSYWGSFEELRERNLEDLWQILKECEEISEKSTSGTASQLGRFYRSVMDTDSIETARLTPIEPLLNELERVSNMSELRNFLSRLHLSGLGAIFRAYSNPDKKNSEVYAFYLSQGGLGLPNRDYYLSDNYKEIREYYAGHIERVYRILGQDDGVAREVSSRILALETEMAKNSRAPADLRDAEKNYNPFQLSALAGKYPNLELGRYITELSLPKMEHLIIGQPEYFTYVDSIFTESNLSLLKQYFHWVIVNSSSPYLFSELEEEHFDMYNRKLRGQEVPELRWKKAVHTVDQFLGEALGELYVKRHFGEESRKRMENLINDIRQVFTERLKGLPWMGEATKEQALRKFERFRQKIGHPPVFRDYSSVGISADDLAGNVRRAVEFEIKRTLGRIGGKVDRTEWYMTPPTVNAYFSPPDNEIVFPAGILQPPFFDREMDDAVNYGAIGAVISHEITHGYDDQGRRYDLQGNLNDWWTEEDRKNFLERAGELVDLYSSLEVLPGFRVNGNLTLGENIADLGGVSIAYEALQKHLEKNPDMRTEIDGLTPEQRFFISWAQIWKSNQKDQHTKMLISIDPHSPNRFRATVPVYNHPDFESAFSNGTSPVGHNGGRKKIGLW